MSKQTTITINGRVYDAATGLPAAKSHPRTTRQSLRTSATAPAVASGTSSTKRPQPATTMHAKTQRSRTLNRKFVQKNLSQSNAKPVPVAAAVPEPVAVKTVHAIKSHPGKRIEGMRTASRTTGSAARTNISLAKRSAANRTNLQPVAANPAPTPTPAPIATEAPLPHPAVVRAHAVQSQKKAQSAPKQPPASILKQAAINEALSTAPKHSAKQHKQTTRRSKLLSFVSGFAALILFAGYLTYLNVPNLSVRVAAAQAGIDASYPGYRPDGYKLNGPVAYSEGEVQMKFAANTGQSGYTLSQSRSSWDSRALLENYVKDKSDGDYITSQERGITVYSYGGKAAWVSGGILYTIDGNAPLSPEQIRKIATSV